ncbi:hypothetical protein BH11PSE8_BH11PSE8_12520 [soil metagenome]
MFWRKLAAGVAAALSFVGMANASMLSFVGINDSGSLLFSTVQDGATLSALAQFTLTSRTQTQAVFSVSIANNSSGPGTNRLMSMGIDVVSPTLTSASGSGNWSAGVGQTLPSFQTVDLCIYASNGCAGGNINNGLGEGLADLFTLTLATAGDFTPGITFNSPFGVKFQDVGRSGNSYEFAGDPCTGGQCGGGGGGGPNQIPEPTSLLLVGAALVGLAATTRRRAA